MGSGDGGRLVRGDKEGETERGEKHRREGEKIRKGKVCRRVLRRGREGRERERVGTWDIN